ncbi:MAG: Type 1 glutamine amidotransferase-like domain-containing protein [Solobacterium sp.]|nr:Type 1 glutamine amidotransferase-like domain-containing protein [Solobacterium sp.]MBQ1320639.1 Type 1 glutamine amidotransferase-like domain-containing protein [Solobacterium sp.]
MTRKIVAIGGGDNGYIRSDGTKSAYETGAMDQEIIRLTGKEHPNYLLIAHSQPYERQEGYFTVMKAIYADMYGCPCRTLYSPQLSEPETVKEMIDWADIIFEGGGDTMNMIKLWRETGFDKVLRQAWEDGKVMCGVSAGGNCWFEECSTDSLRIQTGNYDLPLTSCACLGFLPGMFVPHCDEAGRQESVKDLLKDTGQFALQMSNCTALEIVDDVWRLITTDASGHGIEAYGLKTRWVNNEYCVEQLVRSAEWKPLAQLLAK